MTNKLKYFVGNWKMFGDFSSFKIIDKINRYTRKNIKANKAKIILCVPNTLLYFFKKKLKSKSIYLGAQNCHYEDGFGAFTGSVSASMLKKVGAEYIILGHSENRSDGETNKIIKKKVHLALNQKLNIILCIGETLKEKNNGNTFNILKKQIDEILERKFNKYKLFLAYEPIWSIGTNKIPKVSELATTIKFVKKYSSQILKVKDYPKVLYGGSVNDKNIRFLSSIKEIDGFLIGGASQSAKKFIDIIKNYYK